MRKISVIVLAALISVFCISAYANDLESFRLQESLHGRKFVKNEPGTENVIGVGELFNVNGVDYLYRKWGNERTIPTPYDESLSKIMFEDYVITGNYYLVRNCENDGAFFAYFPNNTLDIYDKNMKLLHSEDFGGGVYVSSMGYADGTFYARYEEKYELIKDKTGNEIRNRIYGTDKSNSQQHERMVTVKSIDMLNWEETEETVPLSNNMCDIQNNKTTVTGNMTEINYENRRAAENICKLGDWFLSVGKSDREFIEKIYLSNDNVYFAEIAVPSELQSRYSIESAYEYEDNLIIQLESNEYYKIAKHALVEKLNGMRNATYVIMNDKLLGFEIPPIIESNRTLVPMRFLFEQMGANVDWNAETQTATATLDNTSVTFTVNNTEADVNSHPVTMDVPARLINGKTMVPLRFLSKELGYTVTWDDESRTAVIE